MIWALRGVLIGFVVVWGILLIACLRKREFCPVLSGARATRLFWLTSFVFVNPLLTILYLVFGQLRSPQAHPVRTVRDVALVVALAGCFINVPGLTHLWAQPFLGRSGSAGWGPEAHLAAIESANNTSTTSTTSSQGNSRLVCRRVAVIAGDSHPLVNRIGANLVERIEKVPAVEAIEFHEDGLFPESGGLAPDLFVRLHLGGMKESFVPYSLKLNAQIEVDVGRTPLRSTHSYHDTFMPPALDFHMHIQMRHTSTTTGYESVRYSLAAANIAKDLGEAIVKALGGWQDKYGLLPELPEGFYGSYAANELPGPLKQLHPALLGSYTGLLTHNQTYLQCTIADEPVQTIQGMRDAMSTLGWKELSSDWSTNNIDLRLAKDARCIHVFEIRQGEPFDGEMGISRRPSEKPKSFFGIADVQRFSEDERNTVIESVLTEPVSVEHLLLVEPMFDKPHRERMLTILENQPPRDVLLQLRMAQMYEQRNQPDKANRALRRAVTLGWAAQDDSAHRTRLKDLAKKLGDEELAEAVPTAQEFRDAGFAELRLSAAPLGMETTVNAPAAMFIEYPQGQPRTFTIMVIPSGDEANPFNVKHTHRMLGGSSSGSRGGSRLQKDGPWQVSLSDSFDGVSIACQITQIANGTRFKLSTTAHK
jgi:hypothetical protein